jgi:hypothetical protein
VFNLWGILVLCTIQIYFFCHLREFARRAGGDAQGFGAPWLPLYEGAVPAIATYASVVALPLAVALAILLTSDIVSFGSAFAVISAIGCFASVSLVLWTLHPLILLRQAAAIARVPGGAPVATPSTDTKTAAV